MGSLYNHALMCISNLNQSYVYIEFNVFENLNDILVVLLQDNLSE